MRVGELSEPSLKGGGKENRGGETKILKRGTNWVKEWVLSPPPPLSLSLSVSLSLYIYIYTYTHIYIYMYKLTQINQKLNL